MSERTAAPPPTDDVTEERLREVVLDLEVARSHERQLREEATVLLEGLRALSEATTPDELFLRVLEALRAPLEFDAAFVMRPVGNGAALVVEVSTQSDFLGASFELGRTFKRALEGRVTTFLDTRMAAEWHSQSESVRSLVGSALCLPLKGESERALVAFTRREARAFHTRHEQLARRFQPLANQALRDVERRNALRATNTRLAESLEQLQSTQRQLMDASRRAGMADVATTVLHNVGNVLNSVNVSAGVAADLIQRSRLGGLGKVVAMLSEHAGDLAAFLTRDEKGKRLPSYLSAIADRMTADQQIVTEELASLQRNVDHIKMIIATQQAHARPGDVVEDVHLGNLLEEALRIVLTPWNDSGIHVIRENIGQQSARVDRHALLQIVTNLLGNAREAVLASVAPDRRITLRLTPHPETEAVVTIEIEDNGCGIAPENLSKVFAFGYTTKQEGHGFGLHGSACSAIEMGGTLAVRSEGLGRGAVFALRIPTRRRESG